MRDQPPNDAGTRGSVLLLGSVTTEAPVPELFGTHAYAAAKGALTALMTTMAATYVDDRIRVNLVAPSLTGTPMATRAAGDDRILEYARASSRSPARCSIRTRSPTPPSTSCPTSRAR